MHLRDRNGLTVDNGASIIKQYPDYKVFEQKYDTIQQSSHLAALPKNIIKQ